VDDSLGTRLVRAIAEQDQQALAEVHVSYRFEGVEEGEPYLVDQQLYCTVADGKVARADLLCSGFRPRLRPGEAIPVRGPRSP
jgi:hypothetical protein